MTGVVPLALGLAVALTALQVFLAWADLSARVLPMADDMLRLAGIRDWLAGQAVGDLTQLRLGPPGGTVLGWSRLPDLVPAGLVALIAPLAGPARAELVALVLWPELLFFAHMLIAAALARTVAGPRAALVAVVLAALATPAAAAFRPGAIAGLGMAIVAVEAVLLALVRGRFGIAGLLAALALAIGGEAAPPLLAALAALIGLWATDRLAVGGGALLRVGIGLAAGAGAAMLLPGGQGDACAGAAAPGLAGLAFAALALLAPRLTTRGWRLGAAGALALLVWAVMAALVPACLPVTDGDAVLVTFHPHGFGFAAAGIGQSAGAWVAAAGLAMAGLAAFAAAQMRARRADAMADGGGAADDMAGAQAALLLAAGVAGALLGALANLSVAAFGAGLAVPLLARAVVAALKQRWPVRLGLSLAAIGLVWQTLGLALDLARGRPAAVVARAHAPLGAGCQAARTLDQIERLTPGTIAAPPELGGHLLGATPHRVLAAPVAAAAAGNRAWYDLILAAPDTARYQAALWAVDYLLLCPESLTGLPVALPPRSLAARLRAGEVPDWLEPVPILGSRARIWRVLPVAASAR